jgi:hypothetical protein
VGAGGVGDLWGSLWRACAGREGAADCGENEQAIARYSRTVWGGYDQGGCVGLGASDGGDFAAGIFEPGGVGGDVECGGRGDYFWGQDAGGIDSGGVGAE